MSRQIAIVFHGGYGHPRRQAEAVLAGAGTEAGLPARRSGLGAARRHGFRLAGAMAQADGDQGTEAMLQSDLDAAAVLIRRVAETLLRL